VPALLGLPVTGIGIHSRQHLDRALLDKVDGAPVPAGNYASHAAQLIASLFGIAPSSRSLRGDLQDLVFLHGPHLTAAPGGRHEIGPS